MSEMASVFEKYARAMQPATADLIRRCGTDPAIQGLLPDNPMWDIPHRITAAVDWLVDVGKAED